MRNVTEDIQEMLEIDFDDSIQKEHEDDVEYSVREKAKNYLKRDIYDTTERNIRNHINDQLATEVD